MMFKKNLKIIYLIAAALILFLSFNICLAQTNAIQGLPNPLGPQEIKESTILQLGGKVANIFISISGSLALLLFVYGGFMWLTSRGEPDKIKKGKDIFLWSVVGLVIITSSYFLISFIIKGLSGGNVSGSGEYCCVVEPKRCTPIASETEFKTCSGTITPGRCDDIPSCKSE